MTDEQLKELNEKLDRIVDALPTIEALGRILIRRRTAARRGIAETTIDTNKTIQKFEEIGHKRTFVEIGEVAVIQKRKRPARTRNGK